MDGVKSEEIIILDSYQGNVLITARNLPYVELYNKVSQSKAKIYLNTPVVRNPPYRPEEVGSKGYGYSCRSFKLIPSGRTLHVSFICDWELQTILYLSRVEILEGSNFEKRFQQPIPFDVQNFEYTYDEKYIFVLMQENEGDRLVAWRINKRGTEFQIVNTRTRVPGDMSLFHYFKYDLVEISSNLILFILSPGQNYLKMNFLDFDMKTMSQSEVLRSPDGSGIRFMGFEPCMKIDAKKYDAACVIGFIGGDSVNIYEYKITLEDSLLKIKGHKISSTFNKPLTQKFQVDHVDIAGEYFMLVGNFGKMHVSKEAWIENKLHPKITQNTVKTSSTGRRNRILEFFFDDDKMKNWIAAYNNKGLLREIYHLMYKRGEKTVFMRGYGMDGHTTLENVPDHGTFYVCNEINSFKVYKLQPITLTELRDPNELKRDPKTLVTKGPSRKKIYETKPWLLLYSTRQLNSPQIYLKNTDAEMD